MSEQWTSKSIFNAKHLTTPKSTKFMNVYFNKIDTAFSGIAYIKCLKELGKQSTSLNKRHIWTEYSAEWQQSGASWLTAILSHSNLQEPVMKHPKDCNPEHHHHVHQESRLHFASPQLWASILLHCQMGMKKVVRIGSSCVYTVLVQEGSELAKLTDDIAVQFSYDKLLKINVSEQYTALKGCCDSSILHWRDAVTAVYCIEGTLWQWAVSYTAANNSRSHEQLEVAKCKYRTTAFVCNILQAMIVPTAIRQSFRNLWVWKSVQQTFWKYQVKYEQLPQLPFSGDFITI